MNGKMKIIEGRKTCKKKDSASYIYFIFVFVEELIVYFIFFCFSFIKLRG